MTLIKVAILTVSDSCYSGHVRDKGAANLKSMIEEKKLLNGKVILEGCVPDAVEQIKSKLTLWSDEDKVDLILTTGGTGFAPRDVTPEATKAVLQKEAPGLMLAMLKGSLEKTHFAMLSRPACGIRGRTLIINLPGSRTGSAECFGFLLPALPHAFDLLNDRKQSVNATHDELHGVTPPTQGTQDHPSHHHHHHGDSGHSHHHGDSGHSHHHSDSGHSHHHEGGHSKAHHSESGVDDSKVARRQRKSPYPLISVDEAVQTVLKNADMKSTEKVYYKDALGSVLAEDIHAKDPLPPFPASIKDGYAVIASDGDGHRIVLGDSTAGSVPQGGVMPGFCFRISTGAPLPPGADAVVQVEDTELVKEADDGKTELEITILKAPTVGQDIRPVGFDIQKNSKILEKGQKLGPSELGLLATVGVTKVMCYKLPSVGVMSTGNELLEPDKELEVGKIRDSNRITLLSALRQQGFKVQDLGIAKDSTTPLLKQLQSALDKVDIIVTSGGVSMGEKDLIKDVLCVDLKAEVHFGRVFMKPGKPTTFASVEINSKKKLFFCLPGNPVSAIVTCNLYVIPALRKISGDPNYEHTVIRAKIPEDISLDPRPEYFRGFITWQKGDNVPTVYGTGSQMSSRLLSMRSANVLLMLPPRTDECSVLKANTVVDAMVIGEIF